MRNFSCSVALILACAYTSLHAQEPKAAAPVPTFKQVVLFQIGDVEKKLVGLAEAMPDEKYSWRPEKGVRSVSEVLMHEAGANVFFMTFVGVKPPAGFDPQGEKTVTEKSKVIAALKASFAHVKTAVAGLTDEDLQKTTKLMQYGTQTYQTVLFTFCDHMHEHLGQLIAYARVNGVTPPWSKAGASE